MNSQENLLLIKLKGAETLDIIGNKRVPIFIKIDIKIGLAKNAKGAKPLKIAERTLSVFPPLRPLRALREPFFISDNVC